MFLSQFFLLFVSISFFFFFLLPLSFSSLFLSQTPGCERFFAKKIPWGTSLIVSSPPLLFFNTSRSNSQKGIHLDASMAIQPFVSLFCYLFRPGEINNWSNLNSLTFFLPVWSCRACACTSLHSQWVKIGSFCCQTSFHSFVPFLSFRSSVFALCRPLSAFFPFFSFFSLTIVLFLCLVLFGPMRLLHYFNVDAISQNDDHDASSPPLPPPSS